jgi:hypothetical protein
MSHHLDWTPETQDVSDVYCFAGPSDHDGPRTVIAMNASPLVGAPWDPPTTFYELKLDLNDDFVEDITWRFTFPLDSAGTQYVKVAQLSGADATSRTAPGKIITPPNAPVGQVLNLPHGIKIFAGKRRDSFFNDIRVPEALFAALPHGTNPNLALAPFGNTFMNNSVRSVLVELPAGITGLGPIQCWGSTAIFDTAHNAWFQVQRAAAPVLSVIFDPNFFPTFHQSINGNPPTADLAGRPANPATDPASGVWGTLRDAVAAIVAARGTFSQGVHGQATPLAYSAFVADTLLPNVLRYTPGTTALWDPWHGIRNGKGLFEESSDSFTRMVVNENFSTGLTQPGPILDYFPYLSEPPAS